MTSEMRIDTRAAAGLCRFSIFMTGFSQEWRMDGEADSKFGGVDLVVHAAAVNSPVSAGRS